MYKVMIFCAGGMSSSLLAKKLTDFFVVKNVNVHVDARSVGALKKIKDLNEYDLYLISPQIKFLSKKIEKLFLNYEISFIHIPPHIYVSTPDKVELLAKEIVKKLK